MSNFPNNPAYNPQSSNGQYAVMTPPPRQEKRGVPLAYTAGGGLLVGIVAGLLLISASPETRAVAANPPAETVPAPTLGELVANEADPTKEADPTVDPAAVDPAAVDPAGVDPAGVASTAPIPEAKDAAEPLADLPTDIATPGVIDKGPAPESLEASLRFEVTPPELRSDLKIEIDGESISSDSYLLMLDPKTGTQKVQVTASAAGYRDFKKSIKVIGDMSVAIDMRKVVVKPATPLAASGDKPPHNNKNNKGSGASKGGNSKGGKGGKNSGPGGLLDL